MLLMLPCLMLHLPQWPYVPWGHNFMAFDVAFTPDGSRLAVGYSDWTAKVWDLASGSCSYTLEVSSLGLLSLHSSLTLKSYTKVLRQQYHRFNSPNSCVASTLPSSKVLLCAAAWCRATRDLCLRSR